MMIKYRVHEVAKDFDVPSKDIITLLSEFVSEPKKSQTVLEENELNIIFDYMTQNNQVESFDNYFAQGEKAREERRKAEAEAKEAKLAEQARIAEEFAAMARAAKAEKEGEAPAKPAAEKTEKPAKKTENNKTSEKKPAAPTGEKQPMPEKKKKAPSVAPNRGPAEIRKVDMHSAYVELDRYNEKYESIASDKGVNTHTQNRQQIKKRPQQGYPKKGPKRETEADKLRRIQLERIKKMPLKITVGDEITVGDLATKLKKTAAEVIKQLMLLGIMATITQTIDYDTAEIVATELGAKVEREVVVTIEERIMDDTEDTTENLRPRSPVVCVMGHVDHGKTSLLDAIRNKNVTSTEAGGITQHIGAYRVKLEDREITFLDTPGHAAFTSMRARGAMATDIAVLVVAADDGIMPQTIEAINHARAAKVQVIVAINKMDKPTANPDRVKQQLTEHNIIPEEWGGDVICVPVSAKSHQGIDDLLENIILVADVMELKANPDRRAGGIVIEARLDKGRGPVATLLVQKGTLNHGDIIVAGTSVGRVRGMVDENGGKITSAGPSVPVEIIGLAEVPSAGDEFNAVSDERLARELVEQRKQRAKEEIWKAQQKVTLDNFFDQFSDGDLKELNVIVKADVQGSVEAVRQSLEKLTNEEVRVSVVHGGVGAINESDVMLANTSNAIIVGFNVRPDVGAKNNAERDGVEIRTYRVIYDCIEEIEAAMKGMLAPKTREVVLGSVDVRQVYKISNVGAIAGSYVTDGKVTRACQIRVIRDGIVIAEDKIDSLKRFKDDAKEVAQGYECGIGLEKFNDIKEGDRFEAFIIEEYRED
ncbi:MAG: translation initiation factor IF-2 [Clostridia bacterium]|nr:translation initiation factor IF-2 [Clostridia bacterium]MBQ5716721.1 translation initiation factor IF-2 [Clostridia bacterium]